MMTKKFYNIRSVPERHPEIFPDPDFWPPPVSSVPQPIWVSIIKTFFIFNDIPAYYARVFVTWSQSHKTLTS
jgi:hypothetical protein